VGKLAFLYPGQGSQRVGMGAELREARPELFDRYMSAADAASDLPVREHTVEGPLESLTRTDVAQPALFSLSLAIIDLARELELTPDFVAGHSLGEYTAAVAAGVLSVEQGIELVSERGRLMAAIQSERPGAMAAILGLPPHAVEELCERASEAGLVSPANINSPVQIVISGEEPAVDKAVELAPDAGATRALRLQVGAAFHSALMEPVQARLVEAMEGLEWSDAEVPLVANFSGRLVQAASDVRGALIAQIASPVLWAECVRTLLDQGCDTFLELGPGRVLTGLVGQIAGAEADAVAADSPAKLAEFAASHRDLVG
jgi:[acyl-carrier-protein] S-malonyltransferase